MPEPCRILFVCLGNICRSPTAQGVFERTAAAAGLSDAYELDSAGTGDWHVGSPPDRRAVAAAADRGVDLSRQRARQARAADFEQFDLILAMDHANLRDLDRLSRQARPEARRAELRLMLSYAGRDEGVPDPYYGGPDGFEQVLDLLETASAGLLAATRPDGGAP